MIIFVDLMYWIVYFEKNNKINNNYDTNHAKVINIKRSLIPFICS